MQGLVSWSCCNVSVAAPCYTSGTSLTLVDALPICSGHQRESLPRARAARQLADLGRLLVAGEAEAPELRTHRARRLACHHARHVPQGGIAAVEFLDLILGEIADAHLARRGHGAVLAIGRSTCRERVCPYV